MSRPKYRTKESQSKSGKKDRRKYLIGLIFMFLMFIGAVSAVIILGISAP